MVKFCYSHFSLLLCIYVAMKFVVGPFKGIVIKKKKHVLVIHFIWCLIIDMPILQFWCISSFIKLNRLYLYDALQFFLGLLTCDCLRIVAD